MCGIAGYIGPKLKNNKIGKTLNLMINRGPDNQSLFKLEKENLMSFCSIVD